MKLKDGIIKNSNDEFIVPIYKKQPLTVRNALYPEGSHNVFNFDMVVTDEESNEDDAEDRIIITNNYSKERD